MADDDGPIVVGVSDCFQIEGLEEGGWFPVTVEVRDQLAQLLGVPLGRGRTTEALSTAIITTVMNLERELKGLKIDVMTLQVNGMAVVSALRMLHLDLLMNGLEIKSEVPDLDWLPRRHSNDDDGD